MADDGEMINASKDAGKSHSNIEAGGGFDQQKIETHKEVVSCWKVSEIDCRTKEQQKKQSGKHILGLHKIMEKLQNAILSNDFLKRSFTIQNPFGDLLYIIEYITPCPKSSYALTISAVKLDDVKPTDNNAESACHHFETLEALHRTVPVDELETKIKDTLGMFVDENIATVTADASPQSSSVKTNSNDCQISTEDNGMRVKNFKEKLRLELATDHLARYFSPKDAAYCEWESHRDDLPTRSVYKLLCPRSCKLRKSKTGTEKAHNSSEIDSNLDGIYGESGRLVDSDNLHAIADEAKPAGQTITFDLTKMKATVVHFMKCDHHESDCSQFRPSSKQSSRVTDEPLIAVAWNSDAATTTECIVIYKAFSRKLVYTVVVPNSDSIGPTYKVGAMTSRFVRDDKSETKLSLYITIDKRLGGKITGYITRVEGTLCDDGKHIKFTDCGEMQRVHENSIFSLTLKGNYLYCGSFDKTFSIIDIALFKDPKKEIDRPMDTSKDPKEIDKPMETSKDPKEIDKPMDMSKDPKEIDKPMDTSKDHKEKKVIDRPMENMITKAPTHVDIILSVVPMSEDGDELFTASWDTTIRYWKKVHIVDGRIANLTSNDPTHWTSYQFPIEHMKKVGCLAFYKAKLRSFDNLEHILLKPLSDDKKKEQTCDQTKIKQKCTNLCGFPEASREEPYVSVLVSGSLDWTAIVWDVSKPKQPCVINYLKGHKDEVISIKILADHLPVVFTSSRDKTIRCWDLLNGTCFRVFTHSAIPASMDLLRLINGPDNDNDNTNSASANPQPINNKANGTVEDVNDKDYDKQQSILGDLIASACDNAVLVWNILSNHRQRSQYSDQVIFLTTLTTPLCEDTEECKKHSHYGYGKSEKTLTFIGTSKSNVICSSNGETVGKYQIGKKDDLVRVNTMTTFTIPKGKPNEGNYLVSGLATGIISIAQVIEGNNYSDYNFQEIITFNCKLTNVFTAACYNYRECDSKYGLQEEDYPLLFVGGISDDCKNSVQIWKIGPLIREAGNKSLVRNKDNVIDCDESLKILRSSALIPFDGMNDTRPVRCISVFSKDDLSFFVTGDYSCKTIIWNIHTQKKIAEMSDFHKQFIINIEIIDPATVWKIAKKPEDNKCKYVWKFNDKSDDDTKKAEIEFEWQKSVIVCTGGYDGKIGLWPITVEKLTAVTDPPTCMACKHCKKMEHNDAQSVTAMTLFCPQGGTNINPLLVTGSIDNLIYVWDITDQSRLRILTGHHNRINSLLTYYYDYQTPILVSGGDDCSTIFWYDGLQHNKYPPTKDLILRTFYSDIFTPGHKWEQMKVLNDQHPDRQIFYEFPQLFFLALMERQESFFIEFAEDLKYVIDRIPLYSRSTSRSRWRFHEPKRNVDLLEYAMHTNSLVALRATLRAWSHVLNQPITNSLQQQVLHAHRTFNERTLPELAANFPVEYVSFLASLRLVRAHKSAETVDGNLNRYIPLNKREIVIGSNDFKSGPLDTNFRPKSKTGLLHRIYYDFMEWKTNFLLDQRPSKELHSQAVMPFMLPIKEYVDLRQFDCLIRATDKLNKVELFDSEVVITAITHYWNVYGYKVHYLNLLQYTCTIYVFVHAIYSYQYVSQQMASSTRPTEQLRNDVIDSRGEFRSFIAFMTWYAIDELCQVLGKFWKFHRFRPTRRTFLSLFINHLFFDHWNAIDCAVVITGIMGARSKINELDICVNQLSNCISSSLNDSVVGSCLLATTAVLLWFKVLYFLRPIKAAGQFVVMVMLIINDIKYFLFVLLCVLTGFAQGFWLLNNNLSAVDSGFATAKDSYFTTFMFMFGQGDTEDWDQSKSKDFAKVFLVAFMLTMMILLLNLLIALMGDSFSRTKEHIQAHYWKELASFMVDQSMMTPVLLFLHATHLMRYKKDEFIHVVKYASDVHAMDDSKETPLDEAFKSFGEFLKVHAASASIELLTKKLAKDQDIVHRDSIRKEFNISDPIKTEADELLLESALSSDSITGRNRQSLKVHSLSVDSLSSKLSSKK